MKKKRGIALDSSGRRLAEATVLTTHMEAVLGGEARPSEIASRGKSQWLNQQAAWNGAGSIKRMI